MKLLTTIAAVLISISAYSQDYVEYNEGVFSMNGEELSMQRIDDLTVLYKSGRRNFRRGNRFIRLDKNQNYRITNNIGSLAVGSAAGFFGGIGVLLSPYLISTTGRFGDNSFGHTSIVMAVTTGLCAVSYKAFSRVALSPAGCLRKRDREFYKVADKINQAIAAANQ